MKTIDIKPYKIFFTDKHTEIMGKKAAMICVYAIHNPLHVSFEDGNFRSDSSFKVETESNETHRKNNGEHMYQFIHEFLNELKSMPPAERCLVYRSYQKKIKYLTERWHKLIRKYSYPPKYGLSYRHVLEEDGHIYIITDKDIRLCQF